jgi:CBS domain-containing protein
VAQIEKEAPNGKTEFWLGLIGPITSAVIGLVCLGGAYLLGWTPGSGAETPLPAMLAWLGFINIALAVFNMIPGFPMDGGRVLRGIIWMVTGNSAKAMRVASLAGQFVAFGFIMFGILLFFGGERLGGLWIAFIGWFLLQTSRASYVQFEITANLSGVTVGDLMSRVCPTVDSRESLKTVVDDYFMKTGRRCFMVVEMNEPVGLITPHEIKAIDRGLWAFKTAVDAMLPLDNLHLVTRQTTATEALEIIVREGINQLPVVENRRLEGIISREQILNFLYTRKELGQ